MADSSCASSYRYRRVRISIRNRTWQLSERLHRADSERQVYCAACLGMSKVWRRDSPVRQRTDPELSFSRGKMPRLQDQDIPDVSGCGIAHRIVISRVLFRVRTDSGSAQVG